MSKEVINYLKLNEINPESRAALLYAKGQGYKPIAVEQWDGYYKVFVENPHYHTPGMLEITFTSPVTDEAYEGTHIYRSPLYIHWLSDEPVEVAMSRDPRMIILDPEDR